MKLFAAFASAFIVLAASLPAQAQPAGRDQQPRVRQERQQQLPPGAADQRRDERGVGEPLPAGRLTPEERRQLRSDIREHGREVYRDRARRR